MLFLYAQSTQNEIKKNGGKFEFCLVSIERIILQQSE